MSGDEVNFDRLFPTDEAALGSGLRAGPLALGQVELKDFLGQVVGEEHPLARLLAFFLLDDEAGVRAGVVNNGGGLKAFEKELQLVGIHFLTRYARPSGCLQAVYLRCAPVRSCCRRAAPGVF